MRIAFFMLAATANSALAQLPPLAPQQTTPTRPVISPYLSLLNNNRPLYQNYFNGVLPLQQVYNNQNSIAALNQQVIGLQNSAQATFPGTGSELSTGKVPGFFTHRGYFLNRGGVQIARGTAGQYGTSGNNSLYSNQPTSNVNQSQQQQPNNSIMPYRR